MILSGLLSDSEPAGNYPTSTDDMLINILAARMRDRDKMPLGKQLIV